MEKLTLYLKSIIKKLRDPYYSNSLSLLLSSLSISGFGFIFWIVAAKIYSNYEVGISTAVISTILLLSLISRMGIDQSIIRFFPISRSEILHYRHFDPHKDVCV